MLEKISKNQILLLLISLFAIFNDAVAKEIAITFDDSPREAKGFLSGVMRSKILIDNLKRSGIKEVTFFSVSGQIDGEGLQRLKRYSEAGHIIANHTHSHFDFNEMSYEEYRSDFLKAEEILSKFEGFQKWFRFPYLREGNTPQKRDGMRTLLEERGYRNAYITVNNYDWYMDRLFQQEFKRTANAPIGRLKNFYVDILVEAVEYYNEMAIKHLGRSPKHVLLLHENDLAALFVGDLVAALRKIGWRIIDLEEAYKDPISSYRTTRVLKYNPGRIGEIARDRGQRKGLWHKSCDEVYLDHEFKKRVLF